jgi:hypothetical protein
VAREPAFAALHRCCLLLRPYGLVYMSRLHFFSCGDAGIFSLNVDSWSPCVPVAWRVPRIAAAGIRSFGPGSWLRVTSCVLHLYVYILLLLTRIFGTVLSVYIMCFRCSSSGSQSSVNEALTVTQSDGRWIRAVTFQIRCGLGTCISIGCRERDSKARCTRNPLYVSVHGVCVCARP